MRKGLIVLGFVFVLLIGFVMAVENYSNYLADSAQDLGDVGEEIGDVSSEIKGKSDEILAKQIEIPDNLKFLTRIVFGLREDTKIDLQTFVILIGLWIFLLLLIVNFFDVFFSGWKKWVAGLVVTCLIAITGAIREVGNWFFGFGNLFGFLAEWNLLRFVLVLIIMAILFFLFLKGIRYFKSRLSLEQAQRTGEDIGFISAVGRVARRTRED